MDGNAYQLLQHELKVVQVMRVHREESVFPSLYPCPEFMSIAGISADFQLFLERAGLENFACDEPFQFLKLTMSVVQDFECNFNSSNPMVHYKIYNKSVSLPLSVLCAAIKVPCGDLMRSSRRNPNTWQTYIRKFARGGASRTRMVK
jgi:hypothetical protein